MFICKHYTCTEQKKRKGMIGKVCSDYIDYDQHEKIGQGGFGNVYMLNTTLGAVAVKEEYKVCL